MYSTKADNAYKIYAVINLQQLPTVGNLLRLNLNTGLRRSKYARRGKTEFYCAVTLSLQEASREMVLDKFTTNSPIKIKRQPNESRERQRQTNRKREREREKERSRKRGKKSKKRKQKKKRETKSMRVSSKSEDRETGQRSSSNDRRPFKSHRLKSFSTNGSSKHRHGFSSTFQPLAPSPLSPSARFRGSISPSSQQLSAVSFSLVTLAHITNGHRAIPRNLYGRYMRRCQYLRLRSSWSTRR